MSRSRRVWAAGNPHPRWERLGAAVAGLQNVVSHWDASTYTTGVLVDDVGSADLTVTLWALNSLNGVTCLKRSSTNTLARLHSSVHPLAGSLAQPFTCVCVYQAVGSPSDDLIFDTGTGGTRPHVHTAGVTNWNLFAGSNIGTGVADDAAGHVFATVFNGADSYFWQDGVKYGPFSPGAGAPNGSSWTFGNVVGGGLGLGTTSRFGEAYVSTGVESDAAIAAVSASLKAKWGTP